MNYKIYRSLFIAGITGILFSCEDKIEIPGGDPAQYDQVYMPAAVRNPNTIALKMADSAQTFVFGACFGGVGYPALDVAVQFEMPQALVDSFNQANGTNYPLLPADSYILSQTSAVIPAGELSTGPQTVAINPQGKLDLFKDYLLPLSIGSAGQTYRVNPALKTAYFVIQASLDFADFPNFERSGWSVFGISSDEPAEGPDNRGIGEAVFDDNLNSFWHTKWAGGLAPPPHWIAIDMGEVRELHGLALYGRQSGHNGKPRGITIAVSLNGVDWTDVGNVSLQNTNNEQRFFVSKIEEARYFRINVNTNHGDEGYTHLAELYAF